MTRSLSGLRLIYCAGGRLAHFSDPFRRIATAILLKRSKKWPHSPTLLATIAQIRQAPREATDCAAFPCLRANGGTRLDQACLAILLVLACLLAGCAATVSVPEDHYYRLSTLSAGSSSGQPPLAGVLRVERVEAVALLRDRALLYSNAASPQLLQRHHYHFWVGSPPVLVRDQLVQYLRDSGIATLVAADHLRQETDIHLRLELRDFSRRLQDDGTATVVVALGVVAHPAGRASTLLVQRYEREVMAANGGPAAAVAAFDVALAEIYAELLQDLRRVLVKDP